MSSYVANWKEVLATSNLSEGKPVDFVSRWLILTRASVFPMTLISGLIERRTRGDEKSGRQITFSSDLIYDVLRRHQPDHLLLKCARTDAAAGLLDLGRLGDLLARIRGRSGEHFLLLA